MLSSTVWWFKYFIEIPAIHGSSVVCSPCIMCPLCHYPPQHKQAGLQIQRNTNRNTALLTLSKSRKQQICSSMIHVQNTGFGEYAGSLCCPYILMSWRLCSYWTVEEGFIGYTLHEGELVLSRKYGFRLSHP